MKITKVETYPLLHKLKTPYGDANGFKRYRTCFLIRITTHSGIEGWGECVDWLPTLQKGFKERIIPLLIGQQATDRTNLVKKVKKWHQRAAAAVSMALTEIVAKKAGLSLCDLWGGRLRQSIPVYASFQSYNENSDWPERSVKMVEDSEKQGYTQIKVKVGAKSIAEDQKHIELLQNNFYGTMQIAIDANQSYDAASARQWQRFFTKWDNWLWFEEPMPMDRIKEYKFLRSVLPIPLAGGENIASAAGYLPLLQEGAIDILQPDTMHQDGIDGFIETLKLARQFGYRVSPHEFDGALNRLYAFMAQATIPSWTKIEDAIEPIEWDVMENPFTDIIPLKPNKGLVTLPDGVGLGLEVNKEMIQAYLWDGSTYY